jgi:hypothetical protein
MRRLRPCEAGAVISAAHRLSWQVRPVTWARTVLVTTAAAVAAVGSLAACSTSGTAPSPTSAAATSVPTSAPTNSPSTAPDGTAEAPAPGWPAPTASPEIAVAQSEFGTVGKTLLTWASSTSPVGVCVDYITDYTPAAGFTVPTGQRAIQLDIRIVNASDQSLDIGAWTIYADIADKPVAAIKDSNYVDISTLPPIAAQSNGYIPARVLIPAAGGTILIGVTNPTYPNQPATFAATLS